MGHNSLLNARTLFRADQESQVTSSISPKVNQRDDEWGGDAVRRQRFLIEPVRATRSAIGPNRILSVKLNAADFRLGGLSEDESLGVIALFPEESVDLLEISGGTYVSPAMSDGGQSTQRESTRLREAFFLDFAEKAPHRQRRATAGHRRFPQRRWHGPGHRHGSH